MNIFSSCEANRTVNENCPDLLFEDKKVIIM